MRLVWAAFLRQGDEATAEKQMFSAGEAPLEESTVEIPQLDLQYVEPDCRWQSSQWSYPVIRGASTSMLYLTAPQRQ